MRQNLIKLFGVL